MIAADEVRHPQHMWIMNLIWPLSALLVVAHYFVYGRMATHQMMSAAMSHGDQQPDGTKLPFPAAVASAASHCGSG